jgi:hypothetical protein
MLKVLKTIVLLSEITKHELHKSTEYEHSLDGNLSVTYLELSIFII